MSGKLTGSLLLAGGVAVAMGAGFLIGGGVLVAAAILTLVLGHLALSHLVFVEERRKSAGGIPPLVGLNLGASYLFLALGLSLLLLEALRDDSDLLETIAKAGVVPGDETKGQKVPLSEATNIASGGEDARLGHVGRGHDEAALGGANGDNQNTREDQILDPEIAGAEDGDGEVTEVAANPFPDQEEAGEVLEGSLRSGDPVLSRVGEDEENVDRSSDEGIVFDLNEESIFVLDKAIWDKAEEEDVEIKRKGDEVQDPFAKLNTLGVNVPKSMSGRCDKVGRRSRLAEGGGGVGVEKAVKKSLDWFRDNQNDDGSWGKDHLGAMTGFGLLCFLGQCELTDSAEYGETVQKAIKYLVELGDRKGGWLFHKGGNGAAYAHGIATYALAEAYGMTEKEWIIPVLRKSVARIVKGQAEDGGWYYLEQKPGPNGTKVYNFDRNKAKASDTSVSGWQFQALKAAYNTGVDFPGVDETLTGSVKNFYRVYSPKTGSFGYRNRSDAQNHRHKLTGVGVLGLQGWKHGHPSTEEREDTVKKGVRHILKHVTINYDSKDANLYSWYYETQSCFNQGGIAWEKWNRMMQPQLIAAQKGDGSWKAEGSNQSQKRSGRDAVHYRTALCTLMLEVYYRYVY